MKKKLLLLLPIIPLAVSCGGSDPMAEVSKSLPSDVSVVPAQTEEEKEAEKFSQWQDDKIVNEKVKNNKLCSNSFVYGIYIDGELCYIGKTIRCLKERLGEHIEQSILENGGGSQQDYLYKAMRECKIGYKFKILYESHNVLSNHDLEQIEKSLIENLQPKFNYEGVKVPYRFSKEK